MSAQGEEQQDRAIVRIAAHLPDLIVYGDFCPERPSVDYFDGVLMFVDISGKHDRDVRCFTAMTEKFSTAMYMDRGAEQLVEILNHYISAIVEKVLIFGGDILKFAGDALLALWKVERKQLKNMITVVVKCSLEIHELFGTQELEGLDIRVKIGLAAGHITMLVFGDEKRNFFLVTGQTVDDVRLAQNMAQMNDVILSPNCWQLCDRSMIEIERIPDQRAVKVRGVLCSQEAAVWARGRLSEKPLGRRAPMWLLDGRLRWGQCGFTSRLWSKTPWLSSRGDDQALR
ncbi:Adenylate cyclase type 10 [Myotis brandtii]|uniref:Adenylate cyclase type 10 n=1 Tax=Myotis brandtii TaxID=109478 RepID=S7Q042_MYOBR|nr:Adenylate cyclase type 10 [Myotis brandtii]